MAKRDGEKLCNTLWWFPWWVDMVSWRAFPTTAAHASLHLHICSCWSPVAPVPHWGRGGISTICSSSASWHERRAEFSDAFGIVLLSSCKGKGEFSFAATGMHLGLHWALLITYECWSFTHLSEGRAVWGRSSPCHFFIWNGPFLCLFCVSGDPQPKCGPRIWRDRTVLSVHPGARQDCRIRSSSSQDAYGRTCVLAL